MNILKDLFYTEDHDWIKVEGSRATIGITDYAQHTLGDIVFVELPEVETELTAGDEFGVVESVKAASDLLLPLSGKVIEINEDLVDDPSLLNSDPYGSWMICIELGDKAQLDGLLSAEAYEELCGREE